MTNTTTTKKLSWLNKGDRQTIVLICTFLVLVLLGFLGCIIGFIVKTLVVVMVGLGAIIIFGFLFFYIVALSSTGYREGYGHILNKASAPSVNEEEK